MNKILIIKLGSLGDVLRTTCILPGLHEKYPNVRIDWLTSIEALDLLTNNPLINDVLSKEEFFVSELTIAQYSLVINLDDDLSACEISSSFSVDRVVGAYSNEGLRNYTDNTSKWFDMSLISRFGKETADRLKRQNRQTYPNILFEMLKINSGKPTLEIPVRELDFARSFTDHHALNNRLVVGLNTGAGPRWRFKQLSEHKTAELVDLLSHSLGAAVVLFGGLTEKNRNQSIAKLSNSSIINSGHSNTLLEFSALIGICDLLITSDSLALHIASCLGISVVTFFGPTSASEIELFSSGTKITPDMDCLCCYKQDCDYKPSCMDNIPAQQLYRAAKNLLLDSR